MQCKLNPVSGARINYPGFQRILDFTATGSESSKSVTVDGDTDKEYKVWIRNLNSGPIYLRFNSDTGNNYGRQYLYNSGGSIASGRAVENLWDIQSVGSSITNLDILTPSGFIKTGYSSSCQSTTGTTVAMYYCVGLSYNSTSNVTNMTFLQNSGNFTAGTRIIVYARRSV